MKCHSYSYFDKGKMFPILMSTIKKNNNNKVHESIKIKAGLFGH